MPPPILSLLAVSARGPPSPAGISGPRSHGPSPLALPRLPSPAGRPPLTRSGAPSRPVHVSSRHRELPTQLSSRCRLGRHLLTARRLPWLPFPALGGGGPLSAIDPGWQPLALDRQAAPTVRPGSERAWQTSALSFLGWTQVPMGRAPILELTWRLPGSWELEPVPSMPTAASSSLPDRGGGPMWPGAPSPPACLPAGC